MIPLLGHIINYNLIGNEDLLHKLNKFYFAFNSIYKKIIKKLLCSTTSYIPLCNCPGIFKKNEFKTFEIAFHKMLKVPKYTRNYIVAYQKLEGREKKQYIFVI